MNFRMLRAEETKCRVKKVYNDEKFRGVMLLLYIDARTDMTILDETVGCGRWQREHYECKGNIYCRVGINFGTILDQRWVWKSDCGTESNTDEEKGESSDSFKRACVNWGIGRELYTAPKIYVSECNITDKGKCNDPFYVREMEVTDGRITRLVIFNGARNIYRNVYEYNAKV